MTDRDLLELAAKAAGYTLEEHFDVHGNYWPWCVELDDYWCPLTDDGDALRLAVKLKFRVHIREIEVSVDIYEGGAWQNQVVAGVRWNTDHYDTTRRAIVMAAAELGRNMK
jgi:hypothetical protein